MTVVVIVVEVLLVMMMVMMNRLWPIPTIALVIISAVVFRAIIVSAVFLTVMLPAFAVTATPVIRQGYAGAEKDHKS